MTCITISRNISGSLILKLFLPNLRKPLKKALKGFCTNKKVLIKITLLISSRHLFVTGQRQVICNKRIGIMIPGLL